MNINTEEKILSHCTYEDIDWNKFKAYYENTYGEELEPDKERKFENLRLGENGHPI